MATDELQNYMNIGKETILHTKIVFDSWNCFYITDSVYSIETLPCKLLTFLFSQTVTMKADDPIYSSYIKMLKEQQILK